MAGPPSKIGKSPAPVAIAPDMAGAAAPGKAAFAPPRHVYGPRTLSAVLPPILKPVFAAQPVATAQLVADWALIVGATLAATTQPRRLAAGTLTIACTGPAAMEVQHVSDMLVGRVNQHLGQAIVQRLRIVQDFARPTPRMPPLPQKPRPEDVAAIDRRLGELPQGPVREALAALGAAMGKPDRT